MPRCLLPFSFLGRSTALEALFDFDVDAEGAVLVAQADDRDIAIHVVLHLNHLLLGRTHVGNIGDGEIVGDLLFDGDACGSVLLRAR